jgi:hypothetical protein
MGDDLGILGGRYQLVRLIGRGSGADVFEACDRRLGATVALKRFREASAESLLRLKGEFRLVAGVHDPGLVRLYDLVIDGTLGFFTMELIDGVTIADHAGAVGIDDTLPVLARVADAIAVLHHHGLLHRDLKPANILVARDHSVRVLDFGLSGRLGGPLAGTLAYMAPESIAGEAATTASDWYAFGAVMYEVLTGRVPASGPVAELVMRKSRRRFPSPRELTPRIPHPIGELIWSLLAPDPRDRPDHGAIADALGSTRRAAVTRMPVALFGRDDELAWLSAQLAGARSGRTTAVLIEGSSGIGKSSLVRTFLDGAEPRSCLVLRSAARPQESVPLRAVDAIVDGLVDELRALPPGERADLIASLPRSLVRSFPVFGVLDDGERAEQAGVDAAAARREAQAALAELVARLCGRRPVVMWIDDIQWADDESLLLLQRLATARADTQLLIVLAGRGPQRTAEHPWVATLERRALGPLSEAASRALIDARARAHPLGPDATSRAIEAARGNAFLLEFFARHAGEGSQPYDVRTALVSALGALDADARALFECVALAQHPLPLACVGRVIADRSQLRGHASRLSADGLISIDELERVSPYHDAIREFADASLDDGTRRSRHTALATALVESGMPIEWQIPHLEGSGRSAAAGDAALTAARDASRRYAFEIAATYYTKALALGEFPAAARAAILDELASNLASAGRGREAAEHYATAAAAYTSLGQPEAALVTMQRSAVALLRSGRIDDGRTALAATLRSMGERLPASPVLAAVIETVRLAFSPRNVVREAIPTQLRLRLETLWTSATSLPMYDPVLANALTLRFVRRALRAGEPRWVIRALALEAAFLAALGGRYRRKARARMAELRTRLLDRDWPYESAWMAATEGSTAWLSGELHACVVWTSRARDMFRQVPETNAYEFALLDSFRLPAMALVGDHAMVLASAEEVISASEARGDGFAMLPCLHGHITAAYLAAEQPDLAARRADRALEISRRGASPTPAYHQAWSRAMLALFEQDGQRAYRGLCDAWNDLRRSGLLRLEIVAGDLRYLRGRCALAANRLDDAAHQIRWLQKSTLACSGAMADCLGAQLAARRGQDRAATARAASARSRFDELGLRPDRDALDRWSNGQSRRPIDRVYVVG